MLLHEYLARAARTAPDAVALVCGRERSTYAGLFSASHAFAGFLLGKGLRRGDRVAVFLDNSRDAVVAVFGILEAGGCLVAVNPATQADRLGQILDNCTPVILLTSPDRRDLVEEVVRRRKSPPVILYTDATEGTADAFTFRSACAGNGDGKRPDVIDADLAAIIYTSGSTGRPKGVTHLHRTIDTAVDAVAEYLQNGSADVILNVLPLSSSYGLLQLLVTFKTCARLVLERGFGFPYEVIRRIREEQVTGLAGAPTIWALLLKLEGLEQEDLRSLRYITNAAAALPASFVPRLRKAFPSTKIYLMHGLTECLRTTYLPPEEVEARSTSVGKGMRDVELWVEDADGRRLPPGEAGEMIVRGSTIMAGYWNDPEATAKALIPGHYPWEKILRTRDLFVMDDDGYFHFVARSDELIKSKGEKVSPIEVEDVLYTLDAVLEVRVIGVPHEIFGQAIRAEIVLKDGQTLTVQDVKSHCRNLLEDFKVPHTIEFVAALPKTQGGKIKRTP
jgi:acyl-CoA synthetase (AMP-forming)/AMP-acid ligase II